MALSGVRLIAGSIVCEGAARCSGSTRLSLLVGITGRVETRADGTLNPSYNVVRTEDDRGKTLLRETVIAPKCAEPQWHDGILFVVP
jgi:hypothetical protein